MARLTLGRKLGQLRGRRLVITAGGSQEPIDPVRVITNRSSGKQGYALAQIALDMGAEVTLISHPTALTAPIGADVIRVETVQQMLEAVTAAIKDADGLVMAAAVADFRVKNVAENKIKKQDGIPQIELEAAPDILAAVASQRVDLPRLKVVVGFAAESRDLLENAQSKLISKKLDLIAANDISAGDAGFAVETNRITLLYPDRQREALPLMDKSEAAQHILNRVAEILE
jgi:phosphopantothenoylcysteine decarboxylase / phosphopantothenate---cysteine ligase